MVVWEWLAFGNEEVGRGTSNIERQTSNVERKRMSGRAWRKCHGGDGLGRLRKMFFR
jgi:hypothetical protein